MVHLVSECVGGCAIASLACRGGGECMRIIQRKYGAACGVASAGGGGRHHGGGGGFPLGPKYVYHHPDLGLWVRAYRICPGVSL